MAIANSLGGLFGGHGRDQGAGQGGGHSSARDDGSLLDPPHSRAPESYAGSQEDNQAPGIAQGLPDAAANHYNASYDNASYDNANYGGDNDLNSGGGDDTIDV